MRDREEKVHLFLTRLYLKNDPRTPTDSLNHPGMEKCAFQALMNPRRVALPFRFGKLGAEKTSSFSNACFALLIAQVKQDFGYFLFIIKSSCPL